MKVQVAPEDIILEYVKRKLKGEAKPILRYRSHFDQLPAKIEVSDEFIKEWKHLLQISVQRYLVNKFQLRQFLFEEDGYVKKYCVTDSQFWNHTNLNFSYRSIDRIWDLIRQGNPEYLLAKPGDALFISIISDRFLEQSIEWLLGNKACWAIIAAYINAFVGQQDFSERLVAILNKTNLPLPLRGYLLEMAVEIIKDVNQKISSELGMTEPLFSSIFKYVTPTRKLVVAVDAAVSRWTTNETVAFDDDRFIRGCYDACGLKHISASFNTLSNEASEKINLREAIHESFI